MKKILKFLSLTIPLFVAIGLVFASTFLSIALYYQTYLSSILYQSLKLGLFDRNTLGRMQNLPGLSNSFIEICTSVGPVVWAVVFFFWYRRLISNDIISYKMKLFTWKNVLILALVSIGCQLITGGLLDLLLPYFETVSEEYTELMDEIFIGNPILVFISTVIIAPVSEELIFRGVIFKKACRIMPFLAANIVQALMFGIFHFNIVQGIYAFGGGLALGYVAYKYNTIKASIVLHMFFNAYNYVIFIPTTGAWRFIDMGIGAIILILSLHLVKNAVDRNQIPVTIRK